MDWSMTASFLVGLFVGWLVEYIIDYFFWRRGNDGSLQELKLRLRDAESELANSKTQIRVLQNNLVQVEDELRSARSMIASSGSTDGLSTSTLSA